MRLIFIFIARTSLKRARLSEKLVIYSRILTSKYNRERERERARCRLKVIVQWGLYEHAEKLK